MGEDVIVTGGANTGAGATDINNTGGQENNTAQEQGAGQGTEQSENTAKTYTQEDFQKALQSETDKRVAEALKTAQTKWQTEFEKKLEAEKDEAAKLATMSSTERAKAEFEKQQKTFEAERNKYNAERLEFECTKQLAAESLPVEFSSMLCGADADSTKANIDTFKSAFSKAIETAVNERLKSQPQQLASNNSKETDPFLQGFNMK